MMHPVIPYAVAAVLFGLGCYGVLVRRNAVLMLMSVELMLNAVNLILVTADTTVRAALPRSGGVFALFVIVLAAAEVGVGLAIVLQLYRLRRSVALDTIALDTIALDTIALDPIALDPIALDPIVLDPIVLDPIVLDAVASSEGPAVPATTDEVVR